MRRGDEIYDLSDGNAAAGERLAYQDMIAEDNGEVGPLADYTPSYDFDHDDEGPEL